MKANFLKGMVAISGGIVAFLCSYYSGEKNKDLSPIGYLFWGERKIEELSLALAPKLARVCGYAD